MDTNPNPMLTVLLWGIQLLTAGVLLFHAYFDLLVDARQNRRTPSAPSDENFADHAQQDAEPSHPLSPQGLHPLAEQDSAPPSNAQ